MAAAQLVLRQQEAELQEYQRRGEEIEEAYLKAVPPPSFAFDCSMLQKAVEDEEGRVSWRDLACDDMDALPKARLKKISSAFDADDEPGH